MQTKPFLPNENGNFAFEAEIASNSSGGFLFKTTSDLPSGHQNPSGGGYVEATDNNFSNPAGGEELTYEFAPEEDGFVRINLVASRKNDPSTDFNDSWVKISQNGSPVFALDQQGVELEPKGSGSSSGFYKAWSSGGSKDSFILANKNIDFVGKPIVMPVQGGEVYTFHLAERSAGHEVDKIVLDFSTSKFTSLNTSTGSVKSEPISPEGDPDTGSGGGGSGGGGNPPAPPSGTNSVTVAASQDAEQVGSSIQITHSGNNTGNDDLELGDKDAVGWRFTNVAIPEGATITAAYLTMTAERSSSGAANFDIMIEDDGSASAFSGGNDLTDRDYVNQTVDWNFSNSWSTGQTYESADVSSLVQAVVDGDTQGDGTYNLVFKLDGSGVRRAEPEEKSNAVATKLTVEYSTGDGDLNVIEGAFGVGDDLIGTSGDDLLRGFGGVDFHDGKGGNDTVDISHTSVDADVDLTAGIIDFGQFGTEQAISIENVIGTNGDNRIKGTNGDNVIDGKGGTDTVLYAFASSEYTVTESNGVFTVTRGSETDTLTNIEELNFSNTGDVAIEDFLL